MTSFYEFKKQASFFFREKIKTARLALTDVTPAQILTEEAIDGNPNSAQNSRTLNIISKSAFEVDDYWRIVEILHKRLRSFKSEIGGDGSWRIWFNALIVLEHLLTHGPESVAEEFQTEIEIIGEMKSFQHVDEKGVKWGPSVSKKVERILKLLEKGSFLKEERQRARTITRGIQGFGSFSHKINAHLSSSSEEKTFEKCNSEPIIHGDFPDKMIDSNEGLTDHALVHEEEMINEEIGRSSSKEREEELAVTGKFHLWKLGKGEKKHLLGGAVSSVQDEEDHHPFTIVAKKQADVSFLSPMDQSSQAC